MKTIDIKSALIGVFFTTTVIFSLGATGKKEGPLADWHKEVDQLREKADAEFAAGPQNGEPYEKELRALDEEIKAPQAAFTERLRASNDELLKLLDLKLSYLGFIYNLYSDLSWEEQEGNSRFKKGLIKAQIGKHRSTLGRIEKKLSETKLNKE